MRILLSAYACEPGKGSEPGVGWHWALELARCGHAVTVLTRSNNRGNIERGLEHVPAPRPAFLYYDLPSWAKWWKRGDHGIRIYYGLWQRSVYRWLRKRVRCDDFDLVHHLTFGVFRQPSYLGRLGIPFIVGPFGGGETTPPPLRATLTWPQRIVEFVRDCTNRLAARDRTVRRMLTSAALIFCKTDDTRRALPSEFHSKCRLAIEIGVESSWCVSPIHVPAAPEFLHVCRLIYWKGTHLLLQAFSRVAQQRSDARLTIVGSGPEKLHLRTLAAQLRIADRVRWIENLPQSALPVYYQKALAMVFPSFRDSSGNVVLEALACGTPVICLHTGGPAEIVPEGAGFRVPVEALTAAEIVDRLANAMLKLANDPTLAEDMSANALRYARTQSWKRAVDRVYARPTERETRPCALRDERSLAGMKPPAHSGPVNLSSPLRYRP